MKTRTVVIATSAFACAALLSFSWSEQGGVSLSVESAQARVGRPLSPVSVAGVARRQTRRAVVGAGVVGAGAGAYAASGYYAGSPYYGVGAGVERRQARRAAYGAGVIGAGAYAGSAYYGGGGPYAYYGGSTSGTGSGYACQPGTYYSAPDGLVQLCQ